MTEPIKGRQTVDHALRTVQQNTIHLSSMADQKASVVLGAAFVMATIIFGDITGLDTLDVPRVMLAVTAVGSGVLAALAVTPRLKAAEQVGARKNLLFFGEVADLERDDYVARMREILHDDDAIYEAIMDDIHQASFVLLRRKYRLLQASYSMLIVGMLATLVAVIIAG